MSVSSCYKLRRSPGGESFAAAWRVAIHYSVQRLVDVAFERAIEGVDEPVFNRDGRRIRARRRYNDRLLMFLLRAHAPDVYRHAHKSIRHPDKPTPPDPGPLAEAVRKLEPVPPPEPHLLMPPEELEVALDIADVMDGELLSSDRDKSWIEGDTGPSPLGPRFDERVEAAKSAACPTACRDDGENDDKP